jgi:glycosyltransferase XagB
VTRSSHDVTGRKEPPRRTTNRRLDRSITGLSKQFPEMSAEKTLSSWQLQYLIRLGILVSVGIVLAPSLTGVALCAVVTAVYLVLVLYRANVLKQTLRRPERVGIPDEVARSIPDWDLPVYTVLVAAYKESQVIGQVIDHIDSLDYPLDLLDVKLLLEADDIDTIAAAQAKRPGPHIEIVRVPYAEPRTKPKACNYGLQSARGEIVTVFDAEDRPEPLQLRKAVVAFRILPANVACLQAKLSFHNSSQNLLTRWFAAEYETWFPQILPILISKGVPAPLGGTSMHIKREILESVGAWDPHNVTEDADLGVRLHRLGYRTQVLDSTTYEEANSDVINWVKQRSRWYKGYLQTWLVHMRHPHQLWRELGPGGFLGFNLMIGATPMTAVVNPIFWLLALLWFTGRLGFIQALFPGWIYYPAMFTMVMGNFIVVYETMISVRLAERADLFWALLLLPFYWVLMSVAGIKAVVQLVTAPSFWEKTTHGLDRGLAVESESAAA